jgi:hypothetical protein
MKRWLTILALLFPCTGCMMIEDMLFVENTSPGYPTYPAAAQQQAGTCGVPITNVAAAQTAEPELLQVRR